MRLRTLGFFGLAVLALLSVVAVGLVLARTKAEDAASARQAAHYTPPPIATTVPLPGSVVIIGDESVARAPRGVSAADRWPALMQSALRTRTTTLAEAGAGYVRHGSATRTFAQLAAEVPTDAEVVVFVGGGNDAGVSPVPLAHAATVAFGAAVARAPRARLVVIGPPVTGSATYEQLQTVANTLQSSATVARAKWVDPIAGDWLLDVDGVTSARLSPADERTLARHVEAVVDPLLG